MSSITDSSSLQHSPDLNLPSLTNQHALATPISATDVSTLTHDDTEQTQKDHSLPLRALKMRVQHGTLALEHGPDSLRQQPLEVLGSARVRRPEIAARCRLGDAGVVGRRRERDVEFFVRDLGAFAVGVDEEQGAAGGLPA